MKKIFSLFLAVGLFLVVSGIAQATIIIPPTPTLPTDKNDCKRNGWRNYGDLFKNQGDCVSFVATNGKNQPDGPPIN